MPSSSKPHVTSLSLSCFILSNNYLVHTDFGLCQELLHLKVSVTPPLKLHWFFFVSFPLTVIRLIFCLSVVCCNMRYQHLCKEVYRYLHYVGQHFVFFSVVILFVVQVPIVACCFSCCSENICFSPLFFWILHVSYFIVFV